MILLKSKTPTELPHSWWPQIQWIHHSRLHIQTKEMIKVFSWLCDRLFATNPSIFWFQSQSLWCTYELWAFLSLPWCYKNTDAIKKFKYNGIVEFVSSFILFFSLFFYFLLSFFFLALHVNPFRFSRAIKLKAFFLGKIQKDLHEKLKALEKN